MRYLKFFLLTLIVSVVSVGAIAQQRQVQYYRLTKLVRSNGSTQTFSDNKGQFVTRENGMCYDSDNIGSFAGNGKLSLYDKNSIREVYTGPSYWGKDTRYRFDDSKGILNVITSKGDTYVFRREQAPAGRTWPSFVSDPNFLNGNYQAQWDAMQAERSISETTSNSGTTNNKNGKIIKSRPNVCPSCHGRKVCSLCNGNGYYQPIASKSNKVPCHKCNRTGRCSLCKGTGKYGKTHYR